MSLSFSRVVSVDISDIAYTGYGVGRVDGKIIFVPFTSPGEKVLARIVKVTKSFMEGELINVLSPGPSRIKSRCEYYTVCGGCQMMHIEYSEQLSAKDKILKNALRKCADLEFEKPLGSPDGLYYRQRARFSFKRGKKHNTLGFMRWKSNKIVRLQHCSILSKELNNILPALHRFIDNARIPFSFDRMSLTWDEKEGKEISVFYATQPEEGLDGFFTDFSREFPVMKGIALRTRRDTEDIAVSGDTSFTYELDLSSGKAVLKSDARSFSQVNPEVNKLLVNTVVDLLKPEKGMKVLDLFCGNGNFSIPAAISGAEVKGFDNSPVSILCALDGCGFNSVKAEYQCLDCAKAIQKLAAENYRPHAVILDPPRAGAKELLSGLTALMPEKIIYISCDPSTLARDIAMLNDEGYRASRSVMADMFPQTYHLESATLLTR